MASISVGGPREPNSFKSMVTGAVGRFAKNTLESAKKIASFVSDSYNDFNKGFSEEANRAMSCETMNAIYNGEHMVTTTIFTAACCGAMVAIRALDIVTEKCQGSKPRALPATQLTSPRIAPNKAPSIGG